MFRICLVWVCLVASNSVSRAADPLPSPPAQHVEFDFSTIPQNGEAICTFSILVRTVDKDLSYDTEVKGPRKFDPEVTCAAIAHNMNTNRFKAEVVDKTKLRVYGRIWNGKLIPPTNGMVESADLLPSELPRVKFVGKKG